MKAKWLGHSSVYLTSTDGLRVITDPYTSGAIGLDYAPIDLEADVVTISHNHADHNNVSAVRGNPEVVKSGGTYNFRGVEFIGIECYHDEVSGSQRGNNTIYCFIIDGVRICHLGDLGHPLETKRESEIGSVDLLFVPVGGNFTIDARIAADICHKLNPKLVIPMHYRNDRCLNFLVSGVEDFLSLMERVRREDASEIEISKDSLPKSTEVVVLKPAL